MRVRDTDGTDASYGDRDGYVFPLTLGVLADDPLADAKVVVLIQVYNFIDTPLIACAAVRSVPFP